MNVLMISSESVPFCKSGGLADVVGALSSALQRIKVDVRILLPLYGCCDTSQMNDTGLSCSICVNSQNEKIEFLEETVGAVPYYFIKHPWFTERKGIYGEDSFTPYKDNLQRYTLLNKASLELCKLLKWKPNIIHAHDWTCGFISYLLKTSNEPFFKGTKSMLTIHNLAYQGDFSRMDFLKTSMTADPRLFMGTGLGKQVNMLKSGIVFSDIVSTVSETYAKEIQTEQFGCHMEKLLQERGENLKGIINGIDYEEWNSATDVNFTNHYTSDDLRGKALTKAEVQKECGLEVNERIPLIAMISRIAEQKGFCELLEGSECALERIVRDNPLQMIIIGTGDRTMERQLKELGEKYSNLSVNIIFSDALAHRVEAGADYFLMPSRFEPCGLNQLYSLRYGTIPIAHKTGGLADSIIDVSEDSEKGDGFLFSELSGAEIEKTVRKALSFYPHLDELRKRAMACDFTWERSARSYFKLYDI